MTQPACPHVLRIDPRLLRRLLLIYLVFIVYASFIPFVFNLDPNFVSWRFDIFLSRSLYRGIMRWSWSDIVSNVLLYFPFGLFCIGSLRERQWFARSPTTPLIVTTLGIFLAFGMELGQTLSPYRSPSMLDVFSNGFGTLLGAIVGHFLFTGLTGSLGKKIVRLVRDDPLKIALGWLLLGSAVDSYYPFYFAFGQTTLRLPHLQWLFSPYVWPAFAWTWVDIFMDKGTIFAAVSYIIFREQQRAKREAIALRAWLRASAIAVIIESGKILFLGPTFRLADILIYFLGALCGVTIVPAMAQLPAIRRRPQVALLAVLLALLCYSELWPFDWIQRFDLPVKIAQIEWLPLMSYYLSPPAVALLDLSKKLFLAIPLGFLIAASCIFRDSRRRTRCTLVFGALLGIVLEVFQLAVRSRVTSVTDVLIVSLGSWFGASAFEWFSWIRIAQVPLAETSKRPGETESSTAKT